MRVVIVALRCTYTIQQVLRSTGENNTSCNHHSLSATQTKLPLAQDEATALASMAYMQHVVRDGFPWATTSSTNTRQRTKN